MQVSVERHEGLERTLRVDIPADRIDEAVQQRLDQLRKTVRLDGVQEVLGELVQSTFREAVSQEELQPAGTPQLETPELDPQGGGLSYRATFEVYPEVELGPIDDLQVERPVAEVEDADIDRMLETLQAQRREFADVDRAATSGDQVVIDFVGRVDGEAFEGGAAEDYPLVLGSNSFIPGFEEQLVGVKAEEEKDVTVSFPEEYQAPHLAGKEAVFSCTIKDVKEPVPAEIDDDLAQKYGSENLDALKAQIRERLETEYAGAARAVMKRSLLDELDKLVSFDLPPSLVDAEAKQIAHQLWHEENPDVQGHDHPEIEPTDEHVKLAERRVRLGLLLAELGQKAEVEVSDAEMSQAIMQQARQYPGQERQFFEFVQQNPQMQQQIRAPLFEDKVVDWAFEQAQVTDKEVSKEDLQTAIEALEEE